MAIRVGVFDDFEGVAARRAREYSTYSGFPRTACADEAKVANELVACVTCVRAHTPGDAEHDMPRSSWGVTGRERRSSSLGTRAIVRRCFNLPQ
jgi:hypothetical protein